MFYGEELEKGVTTIESGKSTGPDGNTGSSKKVSGIILEIILRVVNGLLKNCSNTKLSIHKTLIRPFVIYVNARRRN